MLGNSSGSGDDDGWKAVAGCLTMIVVCGVIAVVGLLIFGELW